jgi:DNA-binding NarL/FixJ family response regulator
MEHPSPVRVVVVEDDRWYRTTLRTLFESEPAFAFVEAFHGPLPMLEQVEVHRAAGRKPPWDLVVMDIDLPEMSGIDATRHLRAAAPGIPVVNLTVFDEPATILAAICAGADGYLLKSTPADALVDQLLAVTSGGSPLTPGVARTLVELVRGGPARAARPKVPLPLSDREQEVLEDLARGLQCKQIAAARGLSLHTVRTYVRRIYEKLRVDTMAEAVAVAVRSGLV